MSETTYRWLCIAVCCAVTIAIRALPFVLFGTRKIPPVIEYIGKTLPYAAMIILIIFCVRNTSLTAWPHGLPEGISIAVCAVLQWKLRNSIPAIAVSTALYMILTRLVF